MQTVFIYGYDECVDCKDALDLAVSRGYNVEFYDVSQPEHLANLRKHLPMTRHVPHIWYGDRYVGGLSNLQKVLRYDTNNT
jgi:glutaredoxin